MNKRPYTMWFDNSADLPIPTQGDNPQNDQFVPISAQNIRTVYDSGAQPYTLAEMGINPRGAKNIIWSSEGYTTDKGITVPALTTTQKKTTGSFATNFSTTLATIGGTALGSLSPALTAPTSLDFSPYKNLVLVLNLASLTGTSITFEVDMVDDAGTPNTIPYWKSAALSGATKYVVHLGTGIPLTQVETVTSGASIVTTVAGTDVLSATTIGWSMAAIPFPLLPQGNFQWTISSVTADAWTAILYGMN